MKNQENHCIELKRELNDEEHLWKEISALSNCKINFIEQLTCKIIIGKDDNENNVDKINDKTLDIIKKVCEDFKKKYEAELDVSRIFNKNNEIINITIEFKPPNTIVQTPKGIIYIRKNSNSLKAANNEITDLKKWKHDNSYPYSLYSKNVNQFTYRDLEKLLEETIIDNIKKREFKFLMNDNWLTNLGFCFSDQIECYFIWNDVTISGSISNLFFEFEKKWNNWLEKYSYKNNAVKKTNKEIFKEYGHIYRELFFNCIAHGEWTTTKFLFKIESDDGYFKISNPCNYNKTLIDIITKNKSTWIPSIEQNEVISLFLKNRGLIETKNYGMKMLKELSEKTDILIKINLSQTDKFSVEIVIDYKKQKEIKDMTKKELIIIWKE